MASFNVQLNSRANKDGLFSVYIRVTENRKMKRIKLEFCVPADHFNKQAKYGKWIRMANPKQAKYNKEIEDKIDELKQTYKEIEKQNLSAIEYINKPELPRDEKITIKKYFDLHLEKVAADSTVGYYRQMKSKLYRFIEYFGEDVAMADISTQNIAEYKNFLLLKGLSGTTVNNNFQRVITVFKAALLDDTILIDPFRAHVPAKEHPAKRVKLLDDQIEALRNMDLPQNGTMNWMHHTRNYYLFSYYNAGIRVADLIQLRRSNLTKDGRLEYEMDKTGHRKSIRLNAYALELLKEYEKPGAQDHHYLFPILDDNAKYAKYITYSEKRKMPVELRTKLFNDISSMTSLINNNLRFISTKLELPKSISFHTARHSFADKARRAMKGSSKITLVDIMNSLGHKKIETTQGYMNSFDTDSLDDAMGDIFK